MEMTETMKKYDSYKDSGVEWIGEIPSHWEVVPLKYLSDNFDSKRVPLNSAERAEMIGDYPYYGATGIVDYINNFIFDGEFVLIGEDGAPFFIQGKDVAFIAEGKFWVNNHAHILQTNDKILSTIFCHQLNCVDYKGYITGSTRDKLTQDQLKSIKLLLPSKAEQNTIANYLDQKTSQIDDLIAKKERLIQLLEEERTAIINQAVTKGLNPNVPMKDSGIEWLGEIPEHWISYRLDWVTDIVRGNSAFKRDELLDTGEYVALQYGKTYKVDVVDDSFNFFVNSEFYKENQIVSKGDTILISTSETIEDLGHTCFYNNENIGLIGGEQILLKPNRKVLYEKYLYQYARQFNLELKRYAKGLKVFRFNTNDVKCLFIAIPSIEEQIQIADFLDRETIRIESLVGLMGKEIELLKEYKTALISEVVTGKVDVSTSSTQVSRLRSTQV